jgi:cell division protein FtsB
MGEAMNGGAFGPDSFLDVVQTTALIIMTSVLIYAVAMVQRAIKGVVLVLVRDNEQIRKQLAAMSKRQEELEARIAAAEGKT